MKNMLICLLFSFSASLFAQQESKEQSFSAVLSPGEILAFANKSIVFDRVISDSRCPVEVTCIWPGEAKVLVKILENGKLLEERIISTSANITPLNFLLGDIAYGVSSLEVFPYPSTSQKKNTALEYTIQLLVTGE